MATVLQPFQAYDVDCLCCTRLLCMHATLLQCMWHKPKNIDKLNSSMHAMPGYELTFQVCLLLQEDLSFLFNSESTAVRSALEL